MSGVSTENGVTRVTATCLCIDLKDDISLRVMCDESGTNFHFIRLSSSAFSYHSTVAATDSSKVVKARLWEYFRWNSSTTIHAVDKYKYYKIYDTTRDMSWFGRAIVQINPDVYAELKEMMMRDQVIEDMKVQKTFHNDQVSSRELDHVMKNTDASDFTIVCKDGNQIQVHSSILTTFWPFFKKMMSNDCKERTDKTLELDFETDLVKMMMAFIYKQQIDPNLFQALSLIYLASLYMLPELEELASNSIREKMETETSLEILIDGWEMCRETNSELQQLFAKRIAHCKPRDSSELFKGMEQEKLVELFFDAVQLTE